MKFLAANCKVFLQVSFFGDWIKCTKKNAENYKLSTKKIERNCDTFHEPPPASPAMPKCDQTGLFLEKPDNKGCWAPPYGEECFGTPINPDYCEKDSDIFVYLDPDYYNW